MSIKCDGSSSGALWFQMVCSQSSGAHQHTSCASTIKTQATASRRMSPDAVSRADACPAPVFTSLSPSLLPLSLLSPCHRHRSLCYTLHLQGNCATHTGMHTRARTHTQLVWLCPTFHRCQENNSQRDNSQHLQHDHDEAGREEDNLLSPPSMAASLILTPSLSLYLPAHLSLTHSLTHFHHLVFYRTVFSLPPSVSPLLVLLTLSRVLSLFLVFFHAPLTSHSFLCACQSLISPPLLYLFICLHQN